MNPNQDRTVSCLTCLAWNSSGVQTWYQIDLFGRNRADAAAGETRLEATQYDYAAVALTLSPDIAATYFQVLALRDRLRLTNEQLRNAEGILGLLEQQARIGVISDLELAQQRKAIASQRASLQGLMQSERETLNALAILVGQMPTGFAARTQSLTELQAPAVVAGIPSEILQRRTDIRRAEADLRASNFDIGSARAARFPSIQLTASGAVFSAFRDTENALSASDLHNTLKQISAR